MTALGGKWVTLRELLSDSDFRDDPLSAQPRDPRRMVGAKELAPIEDRQPS